MAARSLICLDHVRAEHEHRLDSVLLEPGSPARQEQPDFGGEPLDAELRHRERSEREDTGPHCSGVGWDDVSKILALRPTKGLEFVDSVLGSAAC